MECSAWVEDFLDYLENERGYSGETLRGYRQSLDEFACFCTGLDEGCAWDTVDDDLVRRWMVDMMGRGNSPRTVKVRVSAVRSLFRYLMLVGRVRHNPMTRVVVPKADKPLPKFFRDEDINVLLDRMRRLACGEAVDEEDGMKALALLVGDSPYTRTRAYLIILMLYMTGMRISELTGLDVGDIDLRTKQVKVTGKRNKQRIVPIGEELVSVVRDYLPLRSGELERRKPKEGCDVDDTAEAMFFGKTFKRCDPTSLTNLVKKLTGTVTSQSKRSAHVFRHTFATSMLNQGGDLQGVKEILGHASLATTQVYTHANFDELRKIYNSSHPRG